MNRVKRENSTSSPSDLEPSSPAMKSRPNSPEKDDSWISDAKLAELGLTREDLSLTVEQRSTKMWKAFFAKKEKEGRSIIRGDIPRYKLPETLPEGYAWGSRFPDGGSRDFVDRKYCLKCGQNGVHLSDECPDPESFDAQEFRKRLNANLQGL